MAAIASQLASWVAKTTEATTIRLARPAPAGNASEPLEYDCFQPTFTYPIFGEQEAVFGYKNLSITLSYTSGSLRLHPLIKSEAEFKPADAEKKGIKLPAEVKSDDVRGLLFKHLPKDWVLNTDDFIRLAQEDADQFRPIGEKIHEYTKQDEEGTDEHYEIYKSSFTNEAFRAYHDRMKLFVLFYIEGSSYIEDDDEKWEIYTVFKREGHGDRSSYHFVGYSTVYPFYYWPENTRMRISQFLILPPFQEQGHGSELYRTLYQIYVTRDDVQEIAVEDPNDEFTDMRDKCDLRYLRSRDAFHGLAAPVSDEKIHELCQKYKLTERQMRRCLEMHLLSQVNKLQRPEYRAFRLQVKKRLYYHNLDALRQLDPSERKEKLDLTFENVIDGYHRLLEIV
ncbi:acyl-CoA N-acyltransferase [Syncephalastrum racemosum]|uniref:Histone acetyltransferase type B catalytic subunit n=1 Tax=Syncephalastrum racemosum TaxID=13706 RepID=A0A1X2H9V2_SYNRA|nr:acyl-CoA N-acyltransferase [Syncephalastrum racemosum]